jgi:hypothetical protein
MLLRRLFNLDQYAKVSATQLQIFMHGVLSSFEQRCPVCERHNR